MAQQTAVEWLSNNFPKVGKYITLEMTFEIHAKFQQAERMHKEQTIDAYKHGQNNGYNYRSNGRGYITGEEYYEQTFTTQAHDKQQS